MAIVENRESIKRRLQSEAARQWGIDESEITNGSFDPLVNLLFGALAVESEKIWHEMEASRSRVVKRMVETVLPEVVTGILPAHAVMMIKSSGGTASINPLDQFYSSGNEPVYFSPAGNFRISGINIQYIAAGNKIDKVGESHQRESMIRLLGDKCLDPQTCWIGIEPPFNINNDHFELFFNWASIQDRVKFLSHILSLKFSYSKDNFSSYEALSANQGIYSDEKHLENSGFLSGYENTIRNFYYQHFITLRNLPFQEQHLLKKYPFEWENQLDLQEKGLFQKDLLWIKIECPASLTSDALDQLEIATDCFPVLNRKLIRQRGKLQPLFNVYPLSDEAGFLGIERVLNGDGAALLPVSQNDLNKGMDVYALRNRNVARFDQRDAFEKLTDVTAHMRDDLAAFNALDNSILNNHLETINKGIIKLKEHLDSFEYELPPVYLTVRTKSLGNMLEVYFWTSLGNKGNNFPAQTRFNAETGNQIKTDLSLLMLPSTGGRNSLDENQMQKAFKEAILTRGKAVTIEDFRTIVKGIVGDTAKSIEIKKSLNISEAGKEGIRRVLEVCILPDPSLKLTEEHWLKQAQQVKNILEQRSTGVLPLYISVIGYNWKL